MREVIISDTSCLLVLHNIGSLELLHDLFPELWTTAVVAREFNNPMPEWIRIVDPSESETYRALRQRIDPGEASAIALAIEHPGSRLILDDRKGRAVASEFGLDHTGTIGIVKLAKSKGLITTMGPVLGSMKSAGFWISPELEAAVLKAAGEIS